MAVNLNINNTSVDSTIQQSINQIQGQVVSTITKNIQNPVLAGAATSLLNLLLGGGGGTSSNYQQYQNPTYKGWQDVSKISNIFTQFDQHLEFSKTCRFLVNIPLPPCFTDSKTQPKNQALRFNTDSLRFACHSAELPGVNLHPLSFRHYAFEQRVPHYPSFDPVTLSFYCFGDMIERDLFDFWMSNMIDFRSGVLSYPRDNNLKPITMSDITITQYTNDSRVNYAVTLMDAFPIAMSPLQLNWADDRIHELNVTFAYTKWRNNITDNVDNSPRLEPGEESGT